MIDIRRVFSTTFAMLRQRGLMLVGMLVLFTVGQMILSTVLGGVMGASMAGAIFAASAIEDPASLLGVGGGAFVIVALLSYVLFLLVTIAQQAAMTALATPLSQPGFGDALGAGFKSAPTLLATAVLLTVAALVAGVVWIVLAAILSLAGDAGILANVLAVLMVFPLALYLACRLAVLVPVVAVDGERGPIRAIRRSWAITEGKVLGILVVFLLATVIMIVLGLVPFLLIFAGGAMAGSDSAVAGGIGVLLGSLLVLPVLALIGIASAALSAALHAVIGDSAQQEIEEAFA
ncbi:glycerophosphoryl diester phosphodiesterase membrane domain-containing protein [Erythrobacter sp.]|uniref:glycerophosphoryl diester phosphodiesterase membrane domain-containing protein n=1 Tax=Erythrobacter sp. TaxID=1042 RepID=UPI001425DDAD|nr:glycerophosphoryl diester phosphodiesterase membrane domain-containing protein [Erythrobacter sp.]QIQ85562.1 MAG: hypothetical protein G9473_01845 [Erythrobacter sp.]